jgi:uncharacterized protein (TIGR00297 family)
MGEEIQEVAGDTGWRKAIPEGRDRLQSRALVWVVGLLLVGLTVDVVHAVPTFGLRFPVFVLEVFVLCAAFALSVPQLRAATVGGAAFGGMICLLITFWTGIRTISVVRSGLAPLVLLFLLTFLSTRAGRQRKARAGLAEKRQGRSAAQIIANLSVAGMCASLRAAWLVNVETSLPLGSAILIMNIGCVAALVEATADTVSSEIGQAFGGDPLLITGLRRVEPGTDGAVTILGSCAGILAGALVAVAAGWAIHLNAGGTLASLGAGVTGLFFDSFLGATVERRGWIGNDLVNFSSTLFAAALAAVVYRYFFL